MRMSLWLAAVALCVGAGSNVLAGGIFGLNPFAPSNGTTVSPLSAPSNGVNFSPLTNSNASVSPPQGSSQATFASPGRTLAGPAKLFNLLPTGLGSFSNTHYIGASMFPTQTDQYLSQFGFQRLR